MGNFLTNHPNIRAAVVSGAVLSTLGAAACSSPEQVTTPTTFHVTPETNAPPLHAFIESSERNQQIEIATHEASAKVIDDYHANPGKYNVSSFLSGVYGIEGNAGTFVNLWPKGERTEEIEQPTVGIYAYLDETGQFDLSKGSYVTLFTNEREITFEPPTKVIPDGSTEVYVNPITPEGIPSNYWGISVFYPNNQEDYRTHLQTIGFSDDPQVHRDFENTALQQLSDAVNQL